MSVSRTRWSDDAFLDGLRTDGDGDADECLTELAQSPQNFSQLFQF